MIPENALAAICSARTLARAEHIAASDRNILTKQVRYDGDETQAVALWQEVLRMDENNELANTGIGKAYLSAGDNEKAMEFLKRGMNLDYYSVAFKRFRNDVLKSNINYILTGIIAVIVAIVVVVKVIRPRRNQKNGRRA